MTDKTFRGFQIAVLVIFCLGFLAILAKLLLADPETVHSSLPWLCGLIGTLMVIVAALDRLKELKFGKEGLSGTFERMVAQAQVSVSGVEKQPDSEDTEVAEGETEVSVSSEEDAGRELRELAERDPGLAMAKVRMQLESDLREFAVQVAGPKEGDRLKRYGASQLLRYVREKDALDPGDAAALSNILPLVNQAIHGYAITPSQARSVIDLTSGMEIGSAELVPDLDRLVSAYLEKRYPEKRFETRKNLLIFSTSRQKTWLSFTTAGLLCVLDNRSKGGKMRVQWFDSIEKLVGAEVSVSDHKPRTGLLNIGRHKNWLYTKALFEGDGQLINTIKTEIANLPI